MENILVNIGLYVTEALFGIALITLLVFAIKQFVSNIAKSKMTLFGLVGLVVIFAITYFCASPDNISETVFAKVGTDYSYSRLIGSGLIMVYVLFAGVILTLLGVEITKPFKK